MRIIARRHLVAYGEKHPHTAASLNIWYGIVRAGAWRTMSELVADFPKAKALGGKRARFEIAGGNYRLIAAFDFHSGVAWIKFIGTHAQYDRIDPFTISQF